MKAFTIAAALTLFAIAARAQVYEINRSSAVEGPDAGTDLVLLRVVPSSAAWTAVAHNSWLHLAPRDARGAGDATIVFSFDANTGPNRSGSLTIGGRTVKVIVSRLNGPGSMAVDRAGNVYFVNYGDLTIKKWTAETHTVSTLISSGLNSPNGLAVDDSGNLYIAEGSTSFIRKWSEATHTLSTLISSGLNDPVGLAVDGAGNLYIADAGNNAIQKYVAATHTLIRLVSSGLDEPFGVAVDRSGAVYIADTVNGAIKEYLPAANTLTTLVSGLSFPAFVAVDALGNVYFPGNYEIEKYTAATQAVSSIFLSSDSLAMAIDSAGGIYFADFESNVVEQLETLGYLDFDEKLEGAQAGSDALPVVSAIGALSGVNAPTSDEPWLTVGPTEDGVVHFSFTANTTGFARSALITVLGQQIVVAQALGGTPPPPPPPLLGAASMTEGPGAGSYSVLLRDSGPWTAMSDSSWLHLVPGSASGTGSAVILFTADANNGPLRTGTLTIAGQTLTFNKNLR
jgi:streptogramin lyase